MHQAYCRTYAQTTKRVIFLGMNPGPFGMVQTGIPFGEIAAVRDWLQLNAAIGQPPNVHPKRPIDGLACTRAEVSGKRLWGLFAERFASAETFFADHFVLNYCPLAFLADTGRNVTPDKLQKNTREFIRQPCDQHLVTVINILKPAVCVGVGAYARDCLERIAPELNLQPQISQILHPSPASPAANRGWAEAATKQLDCSRHLAVA